MQTHPFEVPDTPVIPVVSLDRAEQAVPLARALVAGGVTMLEITLRAPAGLESIRRISAEVPEMRVGAGTVTRSHEFELVRAAGARLAFSPGFSPTLSGAAMRAGVQFIPGVMTPSEAVAAADAGHGLHVVSCGKQHCHWGIAGANGLAGRCLSLDMRR